MSQEVRLEAAKLVFSPQHFNINSFVCKKLESVLEDLFTSCFTEMKAEEKVARAVTAVVLCSSLVTINTCYLRRALSLIIYTANTQNVDLDLKKISDLILQNAQPQHTKFELVDILPDIFFDFLKQGFKAEDFPITLFGYKEGEFNSFMADFETILVPLVLYHCPTVGKLEELEQQLDVETHILVKRNFEKLIQLAFPGIAAKKYNTKVDDPKMSKLGDLLYHILSLDFVDMVTRELPALIPEVFLRISEPGNLSELFQIENYIEVETGPVKLSLSLAEQTEEFIAETIDAADLYDFLLQKKPQSVPKIAVTLCARLYGPDYWNQIKYLYSLYTWLQSLFR